MSLFHKNRALFLCLVYVASLTSISVVSGSEVLRKNGSNFSSLTSRPATSSYEILRRDDASGMDKIEIKTPITEYGYIYDNEDKIKNPLTFSKGDIELTFGGRLKIDYYFYDNMYLLNNNVPDEEGAFKEKIDLTLDIIYGQKKYGHKAVEFFADLENKNKWGVMGAYKNTTSAEVKVGDVILGEHEHRSTRAVPWFKDIWMAFSFNSVLNLKSDKVQYVKLGLFPFQLGNGIALGESYGAVYEGLGLYSYVSDSSAPGICIYGDLIKDKLRYDLYYAKFEDKSTTLGDVFNGIKANHVNEPFPWRGIAKDDELWSLRLQYKPFNDDKGRLEIEPYVYFNEASDQKVEFKADCKTRLGAYGLAIDYKKKGLKVGGEVALNYGYERLYEIDRNLPGIVLRKSDTIPDSTDPNLGSMEERYNYVVYVDNPTVGAPYNSFVKTAAKANQLLEPGVPYPDYGHGENKLTNKAGRIRPAYKNDLNGWMGILTARYKFENYNAKIATEFGYASGDQDPHRIEKDKNFKGFIGLHELFAGKKVTSILLLGEREVCIPVAIPKGFKGKAKINKSFSDMSYFGFAGVWKPERFKSNKLRINPNVLFFWKNSTSYKYEIDLEKHIDHASYTDKASRFMGTELNLVTNYNLLKDLSLGGSFGIFLPGSFFKDVKGVKLQGVFDVDDVLDPGNETDLVATDYRLGADRAIFADISLTYKF